MTKRVVLIGHPVAHSLSGAMQQAAFDALGHRRRVRALGPRPDRPGRRDRRDPRRRVPRRQRHDPAQGAGRAARRPADRGGAGDRARSTRSRARASGSVGHNTDVPGFKVALDRLVGRQKMPRQAVVLGAGGGARAVVYGLITRGLPAGRRLQPPPPSCRGAGQALRAERRAHGAAGDALARVDHRVRAGQDEGPRQRDLDRADRRRLADPGRDPAAGAAGPRPDLHAETRLLRDAGGGRRDASRDGERCSSTRARPRSSCGPASRRRSTSCASGSRPPWRRARKSADDATADASAADRAGAATASAALPAGD